jgi:hypothetical protein
MFRKFTFLMTFLVLFAALTPAPLRADSELEEKFQDMFVTAGYSAAAGAAIGAALLTFQDAPMKQLKFISIGASVGFLGGTALGGWMAIAPIFVEETSASPSLIAQSSPTGQVVLRPWIDLQRNSLSGLEAGAVLARF